MRKSFRRRVERLHKKAFSSRPRRWPELLRRNDCNLGREIKRHFFAIVDRFTVDRGEPCGGLRQIEPVVIADFLRRVRFPF